MGRWLVLRMRLRFSEGIAPTVGCAHAQTRLGRTGWNCRTSTRLSTRHAWRRAPHVLTTSCWAGEFLGGEAYDHAQDAAGEHDFEIVLPLHGGDAVA
jgi:hypothetical protein